MTENIRDHQNLLKVFSVLRKYGIIKNKEIVGWADAVLASEDASEYGFIEISTATSTLQLINILDRVSTNANQEIVCRAILGVLYHLLADKSIEFNDSLPVISEISCEEKLMQDEQFLLYGFSEPLLYELQGPYKGFRIYKQNLIEFLHLYKDFSLENYQEWIFINEMILTDLTEKMEKIRKNSFY
ncbi:hypothetical protein [uncultured Chryseobacterium sp.]|uniref:hypothetical protein n=1 Tax=uncultured Chryseobacterium sp. TaxID=259322 RepID=UPI0025F26391|nr:hypothetical protein [uncultured Chryseobacterium sp.]